MNFDMLRLLATAFAMSVLCACNPTVNFDVSSSSSTQIPGASVSFPLNNVSYTSAPIDIAQASGFDSAQTAKDRIQSAHAKKLTLSVTSPSGANLSFLTSIAVQISAQGLSSVQVAHLSPVPAAPSADLVLDDVDLAPYLKASSFTLTTTVSGNAPSKTTTVQGDFTVNVEASVF
jgi:hypothetical protein